MSNYSLDENNSNLGKLQNIPMVLIQIIKRIKRRLSEIASISKRKTQELRPRPALTAVRSFRDEDLQPVPRGWQIQGPHFIGVGVPKAGTSWWYHLLIEHPQIVPHRLYEENRPVSKELHYFINFGYKNLTDDDALRYQHAFAAPKGALCGEWSPGYLFRPHCLEHMAKVAPQAKVIALLRNPIDRTFSHINHLLLNDVRALNIDVELVDFFKIYMLYSVAYLGSLYAHGLRQLARYYKREQVLVLQYEQCSADPVAQVARVYRFLGVDDKFQPKATERPINRQEYIIPPLKSEERERIARYFFDDVQEAIEVFPEIDLKWWPDFAIPIR